VTGAAKFAAVKTGSTYATGRSYNASVLPSTVIDRVDSTENRRWAYVYNASGDFTKVTTTEGGVSNVLTVTSQAQRGQITALASSNSASAQFAYDPRGKLRTAQLPDWGATFDHDVRSLLQDVRFTSGAWVRLVHDASGTPVRVDDSGGQSQQIAGLGAVTVGRGGPLADLLGALRIAATNVQQRALAGWLPLPEARAQPVPPPVIPANSLLGLARVVPAAGAAGEGGVAQGGSCCGQAAQTIARALERRIQEVTTPVILTTMAAAAVAQGMVDDFLLLRARDKLRKNMLCDPTTPIPPGCYEAHHIVAWAHPLAERSRQILASVGIDLNSVLNGVWIECGRHHRMHTNDYYRKVESVLDALAVKNSGTVGGALLGIAAQIRQGRF
jgi:hypothetical protein